MLAHPNVHLQKEGPSSVPRWGHQVDKGDGTEGGEEGKGEGGERGEEEGKLPRTGRTGSKVPKNGCLSVYVTQDVKRKRYTDES